MVPRSECVFRPADALHFRSLKAEMELLDKIVRMFKERRKKGAKTEEAFYHAWKRAHRSGDDVLPSIGAENFWKIFVLMLTRTDAYLEYVVNEYLHPKRLSLRTYNRSANECDPVRLMELWIEMEERDDPLGRQAAFEARRNFAIASQFTQLEIVDPEVWISKDVSVLEKLVSERLFAADSRVIYGVFRLNSNRHRRLIDEPRITFDRAEAYAWAQELMGASESHQRVVVDEYPCRVIRENGRVDYVLVDDPKKRPYPRLMKYERESFRAESGQQIVVKDNRRGVLIAVAVEEHGTLRSTDRDDARHLFAYIQKRLWSADPLRIHKIPTEEESQLKPNRNPDYWDVKLIGVISRDEEDRVVESFVEQKVTRLADAVNEAYATDNLNHGIRRGEQLLEHVDEYWRQDIFGVDWTDSGVRDELYAYWKARHSLQVRPL